MTTCKHTQIIVPANPDLDDCLAGAADAYIAEHPELAGYDLDPHWTDEERDTVTITVPSWSVRSEVEMTNTNSKMTKILGDVEMAANPEVDGGLVSVNEVPLDDARRMVRELEAAGFVADWTPAEKSEHSRDAYAWLYVVA